MSSGCQLSEDAGDNHHIDSSVPHSPEPRPVAKRGVAPLCLRCNVDRCATVHRQQPLCRACFVSTFTTRFKQTLSRRCGVQPATRVLVGWSGGLSSSVLCDLIRIGKADRSKHRLLVKWDIVHVDCAAIRRPTTDEQRSADEDERSQLLAQFHTTAHIVPLSAVFDIPADRLTTADTDSLTAAGGLSFYPTDPLHRSDRDEQLRTLFRSVHAANRPKLLSALLTHLLSYCCVYGHYSALLTAESATHAATSVISAITKGQGRTAAVHTRMQRRLLGAHWAYPLHDTSHTHIAYWFHYQRLNTLSALAAIHVDSHTALQSAASSSPSSSSTSAATLDSLSRSFIASLDSLFGHSVANVLRTVEKVDRPDDDTSALCCCWCGECLPSEQQFEASLSTQSHLHSQPYVHLSSPSALTSPASPSSLLSFAPSSCYDCRRAFSRPLSEASISECVPSCITSFDSAAYQQQQAEAEEAKEDKAAESDRPASDSHHPFHSTERHSRHGKGGATKQSAAQLKAHIQQFLLDESKDEADQQQQQQQQHDMAN